MNDSDEEEFNKKIDDIILQWLHCVPVLAICSFSDRCIKAKTINCLKTNIKILISDNDIEGAKVEILKRLNSLPLWYPYDPDTFKAELVEDLLNKLKNLTKVKKISLAEWLRIVPLWYNDEERENFSNSLEENYKELKTKALSETEIQDRMTKFISDMIGDILEKQGKFMELSENNRLVNDIWKNLLNSMDVDEKGNVVNVLEKKIAEWIQDMPMLIAKTSGQKSQNEKFVKTLATKLAKVSDLPIKEKEKRIYKEIDTRLDDLLEERGQDMTHDSKKKNVAKLVQFITGDLSRTDIAGTGLKTTITGVKEEMLETPAEVGVIPSISAERIEPDRVTKNLLKQMKELKKQGNSDKEIEESLLDNYNDAINAMLEGKDQNLNPQEKKHLVDTLKKQYLKADNRIDNLTEGAKDVESKSNKKSSSDSFKAYDDTPEFLSSTSAKSKELEEVGQKEAKGDEKLRSDDSTDEDLKEKLNDEFSDDSNDEDINKKIKVEFGDEINEIDDFQISPKNSTLGLGK